MLSKVEFKQFHLFNKVFTYFMSLPIYVFVLTNSIKMFVMLLSKNIVLIYILLAKSYKFELNVKITILNFINFRDIYFMKERKQKKLITKYDMIKR